ncbi:MAG: sensor histidine kinase, partial [Actinomycetota bacterium]|nr:sensor histidine kinase [Actinomycetota bacterium]
AYGSEKLADEETIEILGSLANQAASALENAFLYQDLADREHRLQDLVGQLLKTQEEERRRVAYEVHDGLAQVATAAHQRLQTFARRHPPDSQKAESDLARIVGLVHQTVAEARRIIGNLRPTTLDDFGLAAAVNQALDQLREEGWSVSCEENLGVNRLPGTIETALFRVAQEALTNARKHAGVREVHVELSRENGNVRLRVRDEGRGFDPEKLLTAGPGERVGLAGMRERIALLGGKFELWSRPGEGTAVTVDVPLRPTQGDKPDGK